jgi:hypothetical protein
MGHFQCVYVVRFVRELPLQSVLVGPCGATPTSASCVVMVCGKCTICCVRLPPPTPASQHCYATVAIRGARKVCVTAVSLLRAQQWRDTAGRRPNRHEMLHALLWRAGSASQTHAAAKYHHDAFIHAPTAWSGPTLRQAAASARSVLATFSNPSPRSLSALSPAHRTRRCHHARTENNTSTEVARNSNCAAALLLMDLLRLDLLAATVRGLPGSRRRECPLTAVLHLARSMHTTNGRNRRHPGSLGHRRSRLWRGDTAPTPALGRVSRQRLIIRDCKQNGTLLYTK